MTNRRDFIRTMSLASLTVSEGRFWKEKESAMKIGLVTYQWGKDWDLETIIRNCEKTKVLGVELRTEHKHGVEPSLSADQRREVRKRFADSRVTLLGYGSNLQFDSPDAALVQKNIDQAKELLRLSHDIGGSGVKVKPNMFHTGIDHRQTLEQIGRSLNELGKFADGLGQQVRLEVHGQGTQELPNIKTILDTATHPRVAICWNCNPEDLQGQGLEYNFNLVKERLGDTIHVHETEAGIYPYPQFIGMLRKQKYSGWLLLECSSDPTDKVGAMAQQRKNYLELIARSE